MGRHVTDVGYQEKANERSLKKHAATIHCSNTLSLLQRKISNALLYHAYKELMIKEEHEITVKQLCRLIGYQGNNQAAIKEALKGLISTIIEWNIINDETGNENWTASSIIASVSLEGPICYYAYSPRMKQLLHSPSMFGKIDLVIQSNFRSSYGLALYENCIRYRGLPHTKWFDIDLFKKLMGVPPEMYSVFRDFKRRVLDKAIDEVNTYSDLVITSELIREGRKVARVRFKLKERAKKTRLGNNTHESKIRKAKLMTKLPDASLELKQTLIEDFGFSNELAVELLKEYELGKIRQKMNAIKKSKPYKNKTIENLPGYLLAALKKDFQFALPPPEIINIQQVRHEIEFAELEKQIEKLRQDYQHYREKMIHDGIQNLDVQVKEQFMQKFLAYAEPAIQMILHLQRKKYTQNNVLESPQIKALIRQFALRELDFPIISLEEFVAQQNDFSREAWQKMKSYNPDHALLRYSFDSMFTTKV